MWDREASGGARGRCVCECVCVCVCVFSRGAGRGGGREGKGLARPRPRSLEGQTVGVGPARAPSRPSLRHPPARRRRIPAHPANRPHAWPTPKARAWRGGRRGGRGPAPPIRGGREGEGQDAPPGAVNSLWPARQRAHARECAPPRAAACCARGGGAAPPPARHPFAPTGARVGCQCLASDEDRASRTAGQGAGAARTGGVRLPPDTAAATAAPLLPPSLVRAPRT